MSLWEIYGTTGTLVLWCFAAKLQMAKIIFTMPFDWSSNRFSCRTYFNEGWEKWETRDREMLGQFHCR